MSPGQLSELAGIRQGISGTPHPQPCRSRLGRYRGNAAAARPLILAEPTALWAAVVAGALAREARLRPEAQWVIVPNVTSCDQIVCHLIPPAGFVAEIM